MGNCLGAFRRRPAVEDRLTKPQRMARQPSNIDYKKLRKLILARKLAPCFDAAEDPSADLEECPICFFYYPSLNRSRCCSKGICTECFLQMKPSNSPRPVQCPFCKTPSYAVEYRGAKTKEEKELELAEERRVIEAKSRMQSRQSAQIDMICPTSAAESIISGNFPVSKDHRSMSVDFSRFHEFDVSAEEVMVLEAIWRSLEGSRSQRNDDDESDGSQRDTLTPEDLSWTSARAHRSTAPCLTSRYLLDRDVSFPPGSILIIN